MDNITTFNGALDGYVQNLGKTEKSSFISALVRYGCPCLGIVIPNQLRLKEREINLALTRLRSRELSIEVLWGLLEQVENSDKFKVLESVKKRQNRYQLNKFIEWAKSKIATVEIVEPIKKEIELFGRATVGRGRIRTTSRVQQERISLNQAEIDVKEWERIEKEITKIEEYKRNTQKCRVASVKKISSALKTMLGWWYKNSKVNSISELELESIVPFVKLKYKIEEYNSYDKFLLIGARAKDDCIEKAEKLIDIIEEEFFPSLNNRITEATKSIYYSTLIDVAKYLYRKETNIKYGYNFEDIPIIQYLRVQRRKCKESKNKVQKESLSWQEVQEVVEVCRLESLAIKDNSGKKRKQSTIAQSLQKFLILGLLTFVPPDRQRTIRELELGRTFKYGEFKNNRFISADPLKDTEKKWIICLKPEDYKTGDAYGEWRGEIPNVEFSDGTKFYEYINKWLFNGYEIEPNKYVGLRETLNPVSKTVIFCGENNGKPIGVNSMTNLIKNRFYKLTEVPLTPHQLRHIYATYLRDNGASNAEEKAVAHWMKHSPETAEKIYSHQTPEAKAAPVYEVIKRLNQGYII